MQQLVDKEEEKKDERVSMKMKTLRDLHPTKKTNAKTKGSRFFEPNNNVNPPFSLYDPLSGIL